MNKTSTAKCTVAICHSEEIKDTLFDILDRMKCSVCDISSLEDLLKFVQNSEFDYLQFSDKESEPLGGLLDNHGYVHGSKISEGSQENGDIFPKYQRHTLFEIEKVIVLNALNRCEWNKKASAKLLGIDRTTLYRKIKKFGLTKPQ
jgi:transcriptional regulator with GAF, ATPase, and Fis domain